MARSALVLVALFWLGCGREISRPDGELAPEEPEQEAVSDAPVWELGSYQVRPLASFALRARVLSAERYRFGREAELAPLDLALGWGPMSSNEVIDTLEISQGGRFYSWYTRAPRIPMRAIIEHSANMHLIPRDELVRATLLDARRGSLVRLRGWLVEARSGDGWVWRSSLSRADSGPGACELVLVDEVTLE